MADFMGQCRSNYVRAKNPKRLVDLLVEYDVAIITKDELIGFYSNEMGGMPTREHGDEYMSLVDDERLPKCLAEGQTMVIMFIGSEKERYYLGEGIAINHDGRQCHVSIDEIYSRAEAIFGHKPQTLAEY